MKIYIPSKSRCGKVTTLKNLPESWQKRAFLVVPKSEEKEYVNKYGSKNVISTSVDGIGKVREFITKLHSRDNAKDKKLVMMDDDLGFLKRRTDDPTKFIGATPDDVNYMLQDLEEALNEFYHAGVACREGGNRNTGIRIHNTRMLRVLAYNLKHIPPLKFSRLPLMEDFDVTLTLLRAGFSNCIINDYAQGQGTSNAPGGCSTYRTMELQKKAALMLRDYHSPFVKVVEKKTKTAWNGLTRTDVIIQWKKAYESGATK